MISKETKTAINNATTVSPKDNKVSPPSDVKIVYGPLLKYGAVAIGIVAVIITAAVLTERKVENFNNELALAEPKPENSASFENINEVIETQKTALIASNSIDEQTNSGTESQLKATETPVTTIKETTVAEVTTTEVDTGEIEVGANEEKVSEIIKANAHQVAISIEETAIEEVLAADSVEIIQPEEAKAIEVSTTTTNTVVANTVITTQYRDNMLKRDQQQIEQIKRNHERNIASLRSYSGHQNNYLEQNIKQMEQNYQKHIAAIKRSQEFRDSISNPI